MERGDLLEGQRRDLPPLRARPSMTWPQPTFRVGVTGNPANTNALDRDDQRARHPARAVHTALTRLDHNRAISQLAKKTGAGVSDIKKMTIWGNHSATQYPDGVPRRGRAERNCGRDRGRPGLDRERLHPDRRQARRERSSTPAAPPRLRRPHRRPSTPHGTGCSGPPRAIGSRWPSSPTAAMPCRRA